MSRGLEIAGLTASIGGLDILKGVDLTVPLGEVHALMGPNGSGKSTLCHVLTGKPGYQVGGSARLGGRELLGAPVEARARMGLGQAFQYPVEVPGVTLRDFMIEVGASLQGDFLSRVESEAVRLGVETFLDRPLNQGLSGGERKRVELFQLVMLRPTVMVLDEIDSGLDVDAVREVAQAVEEVRAPGVGALIITHYSRILQYLTIDRIHVLGGGRVIRSGGRELADELEATGYESVPP